MRDEQRILKVRVVLDVVELRERVEK